MKRSVIVLKKRDVMFLLLPRIFRVICSGKKIRIQNYKIQQTRTSCPFTTRNTQRTGELPKLGGTDRQEYWPRTRKRLHFLFHNLSRGEREGMTEHIGGLRQASLSYDVSLGGRKLKICNPHVPETGKPPPSHLLFLLLSVYQMGICRKWKVTWDLLLLLL